MVIFARPSYRTLDGLQTPAGSAGKMNSASTSEATKVAICTAFCRHGWRSAVVMTSETGRGVLVAADNVLIE